MGTAAIDILMSTYRGVRHLGEQVESLLGQTCSDWRHLVRDDGSTDGTVGLLRMLEESHPGRIRLVEAGRNVGPSDSFGLLAAQSTAEDAMFCDQHDVWLPGKLMESLARIREMEELHGRDTPILLFTDMVVVDEGRNVVAGSFRGDSHLDPRATSLNRLLLVNVAAGCSMILNRSLLRLALPFPPEAVMHDYWCILDASSIGKISYLKTCLAGFPGPEASSTVAGLLASSNTEQRLIAMEIVSRRRMNEAIPALRQAASDNDARVRAAALKRLGELGGLAEMPALFGLLYKSRQPFGHRRGRGSSQRAVRSRGRFRRMCYEGDRTTGNCEAGAESGVAERVGNCRRLESARSRASGGEGFQRGSPRPRR